VDETGNTTELAQTAPEPAAAPEAAPEAAPVATEQAAAETPAPVQTLPHTASLMPLIGLAGLVSLAVFAALGFNSRRRRLV